MNRILTADALLRRGWESDYFCPLCIRNLETPLHLLVECPWSKQVWGRLAAQFRIPSLEPQLWNNITSIRDFFLENQGLPRFHFRRNETTQSQNIQQLKRHKSAA
jgi:hypothetical protein